MKIPLSIIILTYNEEIHIERLMKNIADWADEIFVVDSYSTDKTLEIAKALTNADLTRTNADSQRGSVKVVQHKFENQAQQFNWALDNLKIKNEWILRLDADEYLTEELKQEIGETLFNMGTSDVPNIDVNVRTSDVQKINGYYMKRRVYFMGRWIKHGGYYPTWILRLFKKGKARSEQRAMDEHIILSEGKAEKLKNDFIDDNKKPLADWIAKHNNYSSREAEDVLRKDYGAGKKRNFYYKFPKFLRVFLYFIYRYFFRLGFLDGKEGLIFHFLQGCWYRFLVDAKLYEAKNKSKQ
ncbi:MAG: glycosyltransferase family 2 protein [bacterium]|nr:glycosyltransferase family 2 protein [bacterium]